MSNIYCGVRGREDQIQPFLFYHFVADGHSWKSIPFKRTWRPERGCPSQSIQTKFVEVSLFYTSSARDLC